jgi:hypothetical protein
VLHSQDEGCVTDDPLHVDNHFVPRGYLKRWADNERGVWTYRLLVEHSNVREWRQRSTKAIASHQHLYARMVEGRESDELERWLATDVEDPAETALERATAGRSLRRHEWGELLRYLAAQQVRTPAYLERSYEHWVGFVRRAGDDTRRALQRAIDERGEIPPPGVLGVEPLPIKVTLPTEFDADGTGHIDVQVPVGRGFWLWVIRLALDEVWNALRAHHWLILKAPREFAWCTTDDPVVLLKPHAAQGDAGWGQPGAEILFPLGPSHLLYTRVGGGGRFTVNVSSGQAEWLQRVIVEHAYKAVYAAEPDSTIPDLRPRVVSREQCQADHERWQRWHDEQSAMELDFSTSGEP